MSPIRSTRYYVSYKPHNGRPENYTDFGSMQARDLFIIAISPGADILRTWEASRTDLEMAGEMVDRMVAQLPAVHARILEEEQRRLREAKS